MHQAIGAAARLPERERKDLAIHAPAGTETVTHLAARHGVSRKFVYQQTHKARAALDDVFASAAPDSAVLFELAVSKAWLRQIIVALALIGRSSYRGIVEFLRDLLGIAISIGCVHDVLQAATRQARAINQGQDLSAFGSACMTRSSRVRHRCWPASMRPRPTAIFWPRKTVATRTPGACTCSTLLRRDYGPPTPLPMPGRACVPGRGPPGVSCPAMATCSTSSASARGWPTRCSAWPRVRRHGAKRCRPRPAAPAGASQIMSSLPNLPLLGRARRKRTGSPVTSARLCTGCATTFWLSPVRTWPPGASCSISSSPSLPPASRTTRDASARCGWHCRTSVTTWLCYRILVQQCWRILAHLRPLNLGSPRSDRGTWRGLESQSGFVRAASSRA
jgi:hypothetical protein